MEPLHSFIIQIIPNELVEPFFIDFHCFGGSYNESSTVSNLPVRTSSDFVSVCHIKFEGSDCMEWSFYISSYLWSILFSFSFNHTLKHLQNKDSKSIDGSNSRTQQWKLQFYGTLN